MQKVAAAAAAAALLRAKNINAQRNIRNNKRKIQKQNIINVKRRKSTKDATW